MNKIFLFLVVVVLLFVSCKKQEPRTYVTGAISKLDSTFVVKGTPTKQVKKIQKEKYLFFDPSSVKNYWIKDYETSLYFVSDIDDSIPRLGFLMSGTLKKDRVYFVENEISCHLGKEKYIFLNDLVTDPRLSEFWEKHMFNDYYKNLRCGVEVCSCSGFYGSVTDSILSDIKSSGFIHKEDTSGLDVCIILVRYYYELFLGEDVGLEKATEIVASGAVTHQDY